MMLPVLVSKSQWFLLDCAKGKHVHATQGSEVRDAVGLRHIPVIVSVAERLLEKKQTHTNQSRINTNKVQTLHQSLT